MAHGGIQDTLLRIRRDNRERHQLVPLRQGDAGGDHGQHRFAGLPPLARGGEGHIKQAIGTPGQFHSGKPEDKPLGIGLRGKGLYHDCLIVSLRNHGPGGGAPVVGHNRCECRKASTAAGQHDCTNQHRPAKPTAGAPAKYAVKRRCHHHSSKLSNTLCGNLHAFP